MRLTRIIIIIIIGVTITAFAPAAPEAVALYCAVPHSILVPAFVD